MLATNIIPRHDGFRICVLRVTRMSQMHCRNPQSAFATFHLIHWSMRCSISMQNLHLNWDISYFDCGERGAKIHLCWVFRLLKSLLLPFGHQFHWPSIPTWVQDFDKIPRCLLILFFFRLRCLFSLFFSVFLCRQLCSLRQRLLKLWTAALWRKWTVKWTPLFSNFCTSIF